MGMGEKAGLEPTAMAVMSIGSTSCGLQGYVYRQLRVARPMPRGKPLEAAGDCRRR